MLYKPTSPSPCSTTLPLKKGEEQITFHSSVFNCSEIIKTRLSLLNTNATKNYYWYSDDLIGNTIYLRIKLFPDYIGKICEVADDNGNIKSIEYDGMKLIAKINGKEKFYFYLYDTHNDWDGCENQKYYSTLVTALQAEDDNLSMPFIYSEDNPTEFNWGDDNGIVYYWHEERPVSSHWYLVVLSNESFQVQDLEKE